MERGLVAEGVDPLQAAADRLTADGVDILHTIGGDDTNTTRADLAAFLASNGYSLTVVGLPKTIDNDIIPVRQSPGAWTAAEQASRFAQNIIGEHNSGSRMLLVHEVMGRHCGWLTAATAQAYHWLDTEPGCLDISREAGKSTASTSQKRSSISRSRPDASRRNGSDRLGQPLHLRGRWAGDDLGRVAGSPVMRSQETHSVTSRSTRSTRVPGLPASSPSGWMPERSWCRSRGTFPGLLQPTSVTSR